MEVEKVAPFGSHLNTDLATSISPNNQLSYLGRQLDRATMDTPIRSGLEGYFIRGETEKPVSKDQQLEILLGLGKRMVDSIRQFHRYSISREKILGVLQETTWDDALLYELNVEFRGILARLDAQHIEKSPAAAMHQDNNLRTLRNLKIVMSYSPNEKNLLMTKYTLPISRAVESHPIIKELKDEQQLYALIMSLLGKVGEPLFFKTLMHNRQNT